MTVYHLVLAGADVAACESAGTGTVAPGDQLVPQAEAADPAGRHFDCPQCDKALHGGRAHVEAPQ